MKLYTGMTANTPKHLLLGVGAFYLNFDPATDTPETARAKLIGATSGGGEFKAVPTFRDIPVDGVKSSTKGLKVIDAWAVTLQGNFLENTVQIYSRALVAVDVESITSGALDGYTKLTGRADLKASDYADNITYIGTLSGSTQPVMVQVFNALGTEGLDIKVQDKAEGKITITFTGHTDFMDANGLENIDLLNNAPFAIFFPPVNVDEALPALTFESTVQDGAAGINTQASIALTFNRKLDGMTVNEGSIVLATETGGNVEYTHSIDSAGVGLTITPTAPLDAATGYVLVLTTAIRDRYGVYLAAPALINFTTA